MKQAMTHSQSTQQDMPNEPISVVQTQTLTLGEEVKLARAYMSPIAWPTLGLALALTIVQGTLIALTLANVLSYWIATPILGYCSFAWYTLIHDSIHGSIIRNRRFSWVHTMLGWVGSLVLFYTWPVLKRTHQRHHSHTNSHLDPDHILVAGGFSKVVKTGLSTIMMYVVPYFLLHRFDQAVYEIDGVLTKRERREHMVVMHLLQAISWTLIFLGFGMQVVFLYVLPAFIGASMLLIFFQWLPHYPFDTTARYENTRIYQFAFSNQLLLNQNIHLVHHLWPAIPFYLYGKMFKDHRAYLESKNARIEGLIPSHKLQTSGAVSTSKTVVAE